MATIKNFVVKSGIDASGTVTATAFSGPLTGNVTGNVSGTAANVTGTVAVANGGTGATTLTGLVKGNGTSAFTAATGSDIATALGSTNISGSAANVTGTVAVANGGTGATTLTGYVKGNGTSALTASATIPSTDISGLGTLSTQAANSVAITGGTINGTSIGATTQSTGAFTSLTTSGNLTVGGSLTVSGTTTYINSTVTEMVDPILTLGTGNDGAAPTSDDAKDRGIAFEWHNGAAAKVGFFGWDRSAQQMVFIPDATITSEVVSGAVGTINANITGSAGSLSGTVPVANGGTGATTFTAGYLKASGTSAFTTVASISGADVSGNITGNAANVTGTVAVGNGGTGITSYAVGDILYASATGTLSKLAGVATGNSLISGGVGAAPSWGKIGLTTHVSGTLAVGNGGTGTTTAPTQGGLIYASSTSAYASSAAGTSGQVLTSGGTGAPTWTTATDANTASAIVKRDASGNFTAGTITATGLSVSGSFSAGTVAYTNGQVTTTTASVTTTGATSVDTFAVASFRSAKYVAQISDGTSFEVAEFLVIHDGTTVYMTTFGNVFTSAQSLGSFDASIATGTLTVTFTAAAATTKTVKMVRTVIAV